MGICNLSSCVLTLLKSLLTPLSMGMCVGFALITPEIRKIKGHDVR